MKPSRRTLAALATAVTLASAIACSPTEPSCPRLQSYATMDIVACGGESRRIGPATQRGCSFRVSMPFGVMEGVVEGDSGGTVTIRFDGPCQGEAAGSFQIERGMFHEWFFDGTWSGTLTTAGQGCPCPVGPASGTFYFRTW